MFGVSPKELMQANGMDSPKALRIGSTIVIPDSNGASSDSDSTPAPKTTHSAKAHKAKHVGTAHHRHIKKASA
jgi:LysM repeat protein